MNKFHDESVFKKNVTWSIVSIILFSIVFLILIGLSITLLVLSFGFGISILSFGLNLLTVLGGGGLILMSCIIFYFLIKFIFQINKQDHSYMIEITKEDEPKLFELIYNIADEIKTQYPKKVFISSEVNAYVFYNSSFWSMFFPVKKNLCIGLGLVNTCTVDELKAIIAHEFGHFSQKSMKLGSYVYQTNNIIVGLFFNNDSLDKFIQTVSNIHIIINIFLYVAIQIMKGIQWILLQLYLLVNKSYMGLSRSMEFHADEIAASVVGSDALKSSLLKIELSDYALETVTSTYINNSQKNKKTNNLFSQQTIVIKAIANSFQLKYENSFPKITLEKYLFHKRSKIIVDPKSISHPPIEDRVYALDKLAIKKSHPNTLKSETLFRDIQTMYNKSTSLFFSNEYFKSATEIIDDKEFELIMAFDEQKGVSSPIYNNYYFEHNPTKVEIEECLKNSDKLEDLYNVENVQLVINKNIIQNDLNVLIDIEKTNQIKSFSYNGTIYYRKEIKNMINKLTFEHNKLKDLVINHDKKILHYFYTKANEKNQIEKFKQVYTNYTKSIDVNESIKNKCAELYEFLNTNLFIDQLQIEDVKPRIEELNIKEESIKEMMKNYFENNPINIISNPITIGNMKKYIENKWVYFFVNQFDSNAIQVMINAISSFEVSSNELVLHHKKLLLDYFVNLENNN